MPIEVHCPNPVCARVHLVKNRYAGMRGKCPSCGAWMYVPRHEAVPSMVSPRPDVLDDAGSWQEPAPEAAAPQAPRSTVSARESPGVPFEDEAPSPPAPARTEKSRKQKAAKKEVGAEVAEEEGEKGEGEETTPPVRRFGVLALLLVFLGAAGLGAVAASPFLEPGKVASAGEIQKHLPARSVARFEEEATPYVIGAPAAAAGVALLIFLIGLLTRRGGFFPLFLLYLTTLATVAMAWYSLFVFRTETANIVKIRETAAVHRSQGVTGDVTVTEGQQLYAAAGGAGAAALCFFLALLLLHQGALVRFACFVLLGLVIALGPVWIYRHELGLKEYVPPDLEKTIGF